MKIVNSWLEPNQYIHLWRIIGLLLFGLLWLLGNHSDTGVVLVVFLSVMSLARWRFPLPPSTVLLDQAACFLAYSHWPFALFGLALPLFETMLTGSFLFLLPLLVFFLLEIPLSLSLITIYLLAALLGLTLEYLSSSSTKHRKEGDQQRKDRYELESLRNELIQASMKTQELAELAERNRIAQELHDDVGHELIGAVLALKAYKQLLADSDPEAHTMLEQVSKRLDEGTTRLRETVHNSKPHIPLGVHRLQAIGESFTGCEVVFSSYGNTAPIKEYLWSILEACLKEALTNVARHAEASKVDVSLDVNPYLIRLCIKDDGRGGKKKGEGMGLSNLRQRAQFVGGSVSTYEDRGFSLVCVLPMKRKP